MMLFARDIIPWENTFPVAYSARPPICLIVCLFNDRDDLAFLEAQITGLVWVECELRNGLVSP
jgi:hypothetical protein